MGHVSTFMYKSPTLQFWEPYQKTQKEPQQPKPQQTILI